MKTISIIGSLLLTSLLFSCSDDFWDTSRCTQMIPFSRYEDVRPNSYLVTYAGSLTEECKDFVKKAEGKAKVCTGGLEKYGLSSSAVSITLKAFYGGRDSDDISVEVCKETSLW